MGGGGGEEKKQSFSTLGHKWNSSYQNQNRRKKEEENPLFHGEKNGTSGNLQENLSAPIHPKEVLYTGMPTRTTALLTHWESISQRGWYISWTSARKAVAQQHVRVHRVCSARARRRCDRAERPCSPASTKTNPRSNLQPLHQNFQSFPWGWGSRVGVGSETVLVSATLGQ